MTTTPGSLAVDFAVVAARVVADAQCLARLASAGAWPQVSLASAADLTVALVKAADLVSAVALDGVGVVHSSGALPAGHVSTSRWLQVATGMSGGSAGARLARSRALRDGYGRTRLAWLAGEISEDMVRTITIGVPAALRRVNVAESTAVTAAIEAQLVPFARDATIAAVRRKLDRLRVALDPDGTDERTLAAYDDQSLTLSPVGDGYEVRGYLSKESAAVLLTCLDRTVDGWYRTGSLTPEQAALAGDDLVATGRRRMRRGHLNALALAELCGRLLDAGGLGTRHQQRPHVTITVDAQDYRTGVGGELEIPGLGVEPVTAATLDRILCDAEVTTVLTAPMPRPDTPGTDPGASPVAHDDEIGTRVAGWLHEPAREVLYVGRTRRTAPPRLRKALTIRDRHCQFPHCAVRAERCHAHHVTHWEHGGGTDLSNMVLLCHGHHHLVHEGRWQITRTPGTRAGQPGHWALDPPRRRP